MVHADIQSDVHKEYCLYCDMSKYFKCKYIFVWFTIVQTIMKKDSEGGKISSTLLTKKKNITDSTSVKYSYGRIYTKKGTSY